MAEQSKLMLFDKSGNPIPKGTLAPDDGITEGPWYYFWMKPKWHLAILRGEWGHVEWWPILARMMAKHYDADPDQISDLPYCMPRGRVTRQRDGFWAFLHGNDFPAGLDRTTEEKKLVSGFRVTQHLLRDPTSVQFVFDNHETMSEDEQQRVEALIGKVPY